VKSNGKVISCRSACDVFDRDEYCCRGVYGNPVVCQPTYYSKIFKQACPTAYSYAYDDPTSIMTCTASDYVISFCSSRFVLFTFLTTSHDYFNYDSNQVSFILDHDFYIYMIYFIHPLLISYAKVKVIQMQK